MIKRNPFFSLLFLLIAAAYVDAKICCPGIGEEVPSFTAKSTKGTINFPADYEGKWIVFFSHPADFTPVCATEFKRIAGMIEEFKKINTVFVGISVDPEHRHRKWARKLTAEMRLEDQDKQPQKQPKKGLKGKKPAAKAKKQERSVNFPVVSDVDMKISKEYGMIHPDESETQTVRSVFIIDPAGKLRWLMFNPIANGRGLHEIGRILRAMQITDKERVATPVDWEPGKPTIAKAF